MGARCQNLDPAQLETLQLVHGLTLLDAINLDKKAAGGLVQITFLLSPCILSLLGLVLHSKAYFCRKKSSVAPPRGT